MSSNLSHSHYNRSAGMDNSPSSSRGVYSQHAPQLPSQFPQGFSSTAPTTSLSSFDQSLLLKQRSEFVSLFENMKDSHLVTIAKLRELHQKEIAEIKRKCREEVTRAEELCKETSSRMEREQLDVLVQESAVKDEEIRFLETELERLRAEASRLQEEVSLAVHKDVLGMSGKIEELVLEMDGQERRNRERIIELERDLEREKDKRSQFGEDRERELSRIEKEKGRQITRLERRLDKSEKRLQEEMEKNRMLTTELEGSLNNRSSQDALLNADTLKLENRRLKEQVADMTKANERLRDEVSHYRDDLTKLDSLLLGSAGT